MPSPSDPLRIARQSVDADRCFGLDAVPVRRRGGVQVGVGTETPPRDAAPVRVASVEIDATPAAAIESFGWSEADPDASIVGAGTARSAASDSAAGGGSGPRGLIPTLPSRLDVRGIETLAARTEALELLRERHARECPHCTTATYHTQLVFGEGNPLARIVFVGEAPGETEDQLGRPFVGKAGQKLDEMIKAMGFARADVYIANVLKSRPPENRTPLQHEVDACGPYLIEQLRILRPAVIVTLGGPATKLLLATETGITRLRGVWSSLVLNDAADDSDDPQSASQPIREIPVMPTFHPAYLLRNYTAETRRQVWSDLQAVLGRLRST